MDFISVDDDVRPHGLFLDSIALPESCIAIGRYLEDERARWCDRREQDVVGSVTKLLGRSVRDLRGRLLMGADIRDSDAPDPTRDKTVLGDTSLITVCPGHVCDDAVVSVVQTHLTGDTDIEARILMDNVLGRDARQASDGGAPFKLCLGNHAAAIVANNSRLSAATLAFRNWHGGLFFLPTRLRCEDYLWRMHIAGRDEIAVGIADVVQTHYRSTISRLVPAKEWCNEQVAWCVTSAMRSTLGLCGRLGVRFAGTVDWLSLASSVWDEYMDLCSAFERCQQSDRCGTSEVGDLLAWRRQCAQGAVSFAHYVEQVGVMEMRCANRASEIWADVLDHIAASPGILGAVAYG
jgi:hypothetical protein